GCGDQVAACARSLSVDTILARQTASTMVPNLDGLALPLTVQSAFTTGQFNRVPVIEGTNHDEWRLFVAQTDHDSYAADGRRLHSGNQCDPWRAGGSRERDRRRVSGRFVFESERRTRGHRDGRDLRVQRPPRVPTAIAVC